jgi:hypothetical protein
MGMWTLRIWYWVKDMKEKYLKEMHKRHSEIVLMSIGGILVAQIVLTRAIEFLFMGKFLCGIIFLIIGIYGAAGSAKRIAKANKVQYDFEIVLHRIAFGEDEEVKENEKVSDTTR